jgi:hypothetical protein
MKQTAVEWLIEELTLNEPPKWVQEIIEKAKEMEKDQIIKTWYDCKLSIIERNPTDAEQYYNETFNKSINNKG